MELDLLKPLKVTNQIQFAIHPCDPFYKNIRNAIGNIDEKIFVVLNVKLQVKLRFKPYH